MRLIYISSRINITGNDNYNKALEGKGRCLVAIWHESLITACWCYRGSNYHTLTSHSFDGELAARVVRRFGIEAVRGSSSRHGADGLRSLQAAAQEVAVVGFTLDGPRGPRRVAKPGIAILAARTQLPVIPHAFVVRRAKRLNSWDRLPVPYPFTDIFSIIGPAIPPPPDDSPEHIEKTRMDVETALNMLHGDIEKEYGLPT